jgi:hypothetical protein
MTNSAWLQSNGATDTGAPVIGLSCSPNTPDGEERFITQEIKSKPLAPHPLFKNAFPVNILMKNLF